MKLKRLKRIIAGVIITLGMTGCSSVHLYNGVRDQQGIAAKKAWSEVDLNATISAERANLKKLLVVELETQEQLANAIGERELRRLVQSHSLTEGLIMPINERLKDLMADSALPTDAWNQLESSQHTDLTNNFTAANLKTPSCSSVKANATPKDIQAWLDTRASPSQRGAIKESLNQLRIDCEKSRLSAEEIFKSMGGAIGTAWQEYHLAAVDLEARKHAAEDLRAKYDAAIKDYDSAVEGATADPQAAAKVSHAAAMIVAAVDALNESQNPYAAKLLAEENLKALGALAQAITEAKPGEAPAKDTSKTGLAFIVLPELFDDVQTSLAQAKKPLALPLIIRRNFEQLNLEAAQRDIAAREAIVLLSHDLMEALYQQAEQLVFARDTVIQHKLVSLHKESFADALKKGGALEREALYRAAGLYLDAVNRLDARRYKLEYMRTAAYHERALSYAEVNVKQWESLIGTTVGQVADFSASGLRPEQIANALNTLGIFYIGAGVNK